MDLGKIKELVAEHLGVEVDDLKPETSLRMRI